MSNKNKTNESVELINDFSKNIDDLNFDLYGEFISSQEYCIFSSARKILSMKYCGKVRNNNYFIKDNVSIEAYLEIDDEIERYNTFIKAIDKEENNIYVEFPSLAILNFPNYISIFNNFYNRKHNREDTNITYTEINYNNAKYKTDDEFEASIGNISLMIPKENIALVSENQIDILNADKTKMVSKHNIYKNIDNATDMDVVNQYEDERRIYIIIHSDNPKVQDMYNKHRPKELLALIDNLNENYKSINIEYKDSSKHIDVEYDEYGIVQDYHINGKEAYCMRYERFFDIDENGSEIVTGIISLHPLFIDLFDLSNNYISGIYYCIDQILFGDEENDSNELVHFSRIIRRLTKEDEERLINFVNNSSDSKPILDFFDHDDYAEKM